MQNSELETKAAFDHIRYAQLWEDADVLTQGLGDCAGGTLVSICSAGDNALAMLVLDPKTVCVEASEVYQMEQLDKLGQNVIPVDLRDAYAFGGGLHCCTADVYRDGDCEDYFDKLPG